MDLVTKNYVDAFRGEQSLGADLDDSQVFERFADYCVVADAYDEEFDVSDIHVGGSDDLGLDGIAVLVNGALVTSVEEVQDLVKVAGAIDVSFFFVQAKSGGNFSWAEIGVVFDGITDFFGESLTLPANEYIVNYHDVMLEVYKNSIKFRRGKPTCHISYVSTGKWTDETYLQQRIDKRVAQVEKLGLFSTVTFAPVDADALHASYQRSKNTITAEFVFADKTLLPDIPGVNEAYVGSLPGTEFLKLITDPNGAIRKSLFYDNIRDFQDYNTVNKEIRDTLVDEQGQARFAVLNNGVTVVTRQLQTTGNKFAMTDFQIVNGCQTSHVLFDESERILTGAKVQVPLKVVATTDEEIINAIITANNRQTQVTTEDLYALGLFQKRLEAFLAAYPDRKKLFYERRSKQYNSVSGIEKVRVITKPQQIRSFAAMFLDDPHRASRYYADLRAQVGERIFNENHQLEPYYVSAFAHYKLEFLFRNGALPVYYKPARYHLFMAARYIGGGLDAPALSANKMAAYCNRISELLWDDDKAADLFKKGIEAVDTAAEGSLTRDTVKTQPFTDAVKRALGVVPPGAKAAKG